MDMEIRLWTVSPTKGLGYWKELILINQLISKVYPSNVEHKSRYAKYGGFSFYASPLDSSAFHVWPLDISNWLDSLKWS
jgi:hypothetical protein